MITPEQFQEIGETLLPLLDDLTEWIARDMIERFMIRFGRGEEKLLTGTDEWQAWVLKQAGGNLDEIQKALVKSTGKSQQEIAKIFKDSGIQAAKADAEAAAVTFSGLSPRMMAIITDAYERTVGEISNITRTTAGATNQAFIGICDDAYWKVRTGAQSYTAAMLEGVKALGQVQPIVRYPSGHKDTLEVAVLRCIRTGVAQSSGNMTIQQCKDMGWNHVLVSQHLGARVSDTDPIADHAGWQGKVYCIDGKDAQFDNLLDATGYPENPLGLCGYNCRHSFTPFLLGVSQNHNKPIDTEANRRAYELSQTQRAMERRIRAQKRKCTALHTAVKNCEDPAAKAKLQEKYAQSAKRLQEQNAAYTKFCADNDQKPYHERLAVAGWDRSAASTASAAARQSWTSAEAVDARQVQTQQAPPVQAPPVQAPPVIAKLDVQRYSCVAEHIRSSDVILTEKQKEHIIERRGKEFYDKYSPYFKEIIENPDYIFKDKKFENTAIASKTISLNSKNISVVVRIAVEGDEPWRKSSVITVMCENEKRYRQRVRNNIILYKRE
ncbi:MAG: phage minor capsid protein [Agathobaculum butyriciproducens]|nr:phage minor capsid protein [Agathobaculum butyriciproducens]